MREIKFRAWDSTGKIYIYFSLKDYATIQTLIAYTGTFFTKLTIEQFTCLKDKNGTEVYKGDIVAREPDKMQGVVTWKDNRQAFIFDLQNGHFVFTSMWSSIEIIGNIHQNPKLIEDKDYE